MWIADRERSQEIDRRAINDFGIPVKVLMERAGLAVFEAIRSMLPDGGRITVFCGRGNNGGDGFVVARLALEHGYNVECLVAAKEEDLKPDAREQLQTARAQGIQPIFYGEPRYSRRSDCVSCREVIVDALLGTGAKCELQGPVLEAIQCINRSGVPVISVDVPSGIDCDTGEELGESVWACRTVTFGLPKPFLFQGTGLEHCGYWSVADIGFPNALLNESTHAKIVENEWVASLLPERLRASHKGENGHLLIVAGSERMPGAATLATRAAIRAGVGLVTVAGIESVCRAVSSHVPEAIFLPLPENHGVISADAARILLEHQHKFHGALFGPGLTHEEPVLDFLTKVWGEWTPPCVVDADALNAVSKGVDLPHSDCVLTPHPGEMSRLLHCSIAEIQSDRFQTVQQAVMKYRHCILLKGPYSIVGEPDQPLLVNQTGNPGLASGGMGDILGGLMATLLSQDLPSYYAAGCAMYWHGMAADMCADEIGPIGYCAIDVANMLPKARVRIVSSCDTD